MECIECNAPLNKGNAQDGANYCPRCGIGPLCDRCMIPHNKEVEQIEEDVVLAEPESDFPKQGASWREPKQTSLREGDEVQWKFGGEKAPKMIVSEIHQVSDTVWEVVCIWIDDVGKTRVEIHHNYNLYFAGRPYQFPHCLSPEEQNFDLKNMSFAEFLYRGETFYLIDSFGDDQTFFAYNPDHEPPLLVVRLPKPLKEYTSGR